MVPHSLGQTAKSPTGMHPYLAPENPIPTTHTLQCPGLRPGGVVASDHPAMVLLPSGSPPTALPRVQHSSSCLLTDRSELLLPQIRNVLEKKLAGGFAQARQRLAA